jgi:transcription initiation factor TFIIH subunit 1
MNPKVADRVCMNLTDRVRKRSRYYEKSSNSGNERTAHSSLFDLIKSWYFLLLDEKLPTPALLAIQSYHSATNEILRHFWSSNDPYRADKNARMVEGLKRQQKKYNEVLITVNSHRGDVDRGKEVNV